MIGSTLSHYHIEAELGRGGMGIVYRARDTKLNRQVAIKVLPPSALTSEDDRARFFREAQSAAQLTHPNIATIYQIDEAVPEGGSSEEPRPFIAMEFIDGKTLEDRIKEGPLKLDEVIPLASQVASALGAAHAKDIVHRDIKSANIMLTADGQAKVLDFGLALTAQSTKLTRMGSTLGTVAYMSPEQARGEEVDHRTDLWALGVVIYEMIVGSNPFGGDYEQAVVYSILNEDPEPVTALRTGVPMELEQLIEKCLRKDAAHRYQSAADLLADLKALALGGSGISRSGMSRSSMSRSSMTRGSLSRAAMQPGGASEPAVAAPNLLRSSPAWVWPSLLLLVALTASLLTWFLKPQSAEQGYTVPAVFTLEAEEDWDQTIAGLSPSGRYVAFRRSGKENSSDIALVLKDLQTGQDRVVSDQSVYSVDFSEDESQMVFLADGGTYRAGTASGTPFNVGDGGWDVRFIGQDRLATSRPDGVWVSDLDGDGFTRAVPLDSLQGHAAIGIVQWLEEDQILGGVSTLNNEVFTVIIDVDSGTYETIMEGGFPQGYVESGHMIYAMVGESGDTETTAVRPFDLDRRVFTGPASPLFESSTFYPYLLVSQRGTLAWTDQDPYQWQQRLMWLGQELEDEQLEAPLDRYDNIRLSPDGKQLAFRGRESDTRHDIFMLEIEGGNLTRFSFTESGSMPVFSADGSTVYFATMADGWLGDAVMRKPTDGSQASRPVPVPRNGSATRYLTDVSPDEDLFAFSIFSPFRVVTEIQSLSDSTKRQVIQRGRRMGDGVFSPDGRFIAVAMRDGDNEEVQVHEVFGDAFWTVSLPDQKAEIPKWSKDGQWLYYRTEDELWGARVQLEPSFTRERPQLISGGFERVWSYDVHPDGERFVAAVPQDTAADSTRENRTYIRINAKQWLSQLAPPTQ